MRSRRGPWASYLGRRIRSSGLLLTSSGAEAAAPTQLTAHAALVDGRWPADRGPAGAGEPVETVIRLEDGRLAGN